jgi:hypothetical protein
MKLSCAVITAALAILATKCDPAHADVSDFTSDNWKLTHDHVTAEFQRRQRMLESVPIKDLLTEAIAEVKAGMLPECQDDFGCMLEADADAYNYLFQCSGESMNNADWERVGAPLSKDRVKACKRAYAHLDALWTHYCQPIERARDNTSLLTKRAAGEKFLIPGQRR